MESSGSKGNKNTYFNSVNTGNNVLIDLQHKGFKSLNDEIKLDTLTNSFKSAKEFLLLCINTLFNTHCSIGE